MIVPPTSSTGPRRPRAREGWERVILQPQDGRSLSDRPRGFWSLGAGKRPLPITDSIQVLLTASSSRTLTSPCRRTPAERVVGLIIRVFLLSCSRSLDEATVLGHFGAVSLSTHHSESAALGCTAYEEPWFRFAAFFFAWRSVKGRPSRPGPLGPRHYALTRPLAESNSILSHGLSLALSLAAYQAHAPPEDTAGPMIKTAGKA